MMDDHTQVENIGPTIGNHHCSYQVLFVAEKNVCFAHGNLGSGIEPESPKAMQAVAIYPVIEHMENPPIRSIIS